MRYAVFASTPLGDQLVLSGGSRAVSTQADALTRDRVAVGDVSLIGGRAGVELVCSGNVLTATFGIAQSTVTTTELGASGNTGSYGWRLDEGKLYLAGSVVATGLPVVTMGQAVGLLLDLPGKTLTLYVGRTSVHQRVLTTAEAAQTWWFGASLGSVVAGDCIAAINTGGSGAATPALLGGGWPMATTTPTTYRVATDDWLTDATDAPANARYEGAIDAAGIELVAQVSFWPWASNTAATAVGDVPLLDAVGRLDAISEQNADVLIRRLFAGQALSAATSLGRYRLRGVEVSSDMQRSLHLRDALAQLDDPLPREIYLPMAGDTLAWQPQPIVIGAVRNAPLSAVNSDGTLQWMADAPCIIRSLRERGRDLTVDTDFAPDRSRQAVSVVSPPFGSLCADVSSTGELDADLWGGGVAHTGTLGGSASTLASGAAARYAMTAIVPAGGRLVVSLTDDTDGALLAVEASGSYEGVIVNPLASAATLYLIATGGAAATAVTIHTLLDTTTEPAPANLALALREVFRRARFGGWSLSDAQAIDAATGYSGIGLYVGQDAMTARQLYRQALESYCAGDYQDEDGTLRFARLIDPAGQPATFALSESDLMSDLDVQDDLAPHLTTRMSWRPNAVQLSADGITSDTLAVPAWRRAQLTAVAQGIVWSGVPLADRYARAAAAAPPMPSRFDQLADAQAEIDRVCSIYTADRTFWTTRLMSDKSFRPGQFGTLSYARHALASKPVMVVGVRHNPVTLDTELTLWG